MALKLLPNTFLSASCVLQLALCIYSSIDQALIVFIVFVELLNVIRLTSSLWLHDRNGYSDFYIDQRITHLLIDEPERR